jgi:hypothetical protein
VNEDWWCEYHVYIDIIDEEDINPYVIAEELFVGLDDMTNISNIE